MIDSNLISNSPCERVEVLEQHGFVGFPDRDGDEPLSSS